MNGVPAKTVKKIQTLAQIAVELRQGEHFKITRLTMLKSLCSDEEAAMKFALHIAKKTQLAMKTKKRPSHIKLEEWERYQRLVGSAVRRMTKRLKEGTTEAEEPLRELLSEIRNTQSQYEYQRWGPVRIVQSMELLVVETALECVLHPWASSDLGYRVARQYADTTLDTEQGFSPNLLRWSKISLSFGDGISLAGVGKSVWRSDPNRH